MVQSLDSVTGLPVIGPADIVEQILLGQQVFPFADLSATQRPVRQPYYGDDVIPTSSLVVGQDKTGAPRAGRMDTARNLYVREAVFQSNGAPIKDGTTAPVDVFVTNGGGSSAIAIGSTDGPSNVQLNIGGGSSNLIPSINFAKAIVMLNVCCYPAFQDAAAAQSGFVDIAFHDPTHFTTLNIGSVAFAQAGTIPSALLGGQMLLVFPGGFDISGFFAGATDVDLIGSLAGGHAVEVNVSATLWYGV